MSAGAPGADIAEADVKTSPAPTGTATGWRLARSVAFRYRRQLGPLWVLLFLVAAAWIATYAHPLKVFGVSVFGVILVVAALHRRLHKPRERLYAGVCLAGAVAGVTSLSAVGLDSRTLNTICALGWLAASARWWWRHRIRESSWGVSPTAVEVIAAWKEHIAGAQKDGRGKGPMFGALMSPDPPFEHGENLTITLVPYVQSYRIAMKDMLAGWETGLGIPLERLVLEKHPDHPENPRKLRLRVVTRSPIKDTVYFTGPRHQDGRVLLGPHVDGVGEVSIRVYTKNSMWSTLLVGGTGLGKTGVEESVAITLRDPSFPPTVIFYMDGQDGASNQLLYEHATWSVGCDGAPRMLAALERIAAHRNWKRRTRRWTGVAPTSADPGIMLMIDEFQNIFPPMCERFADAARTWRKLLMAIFAASQGFQLDNFGPKKVERRDVLRSQLLAGNGLVMRVDSKVTANLIPGLEVNPYDLPRTPGYLIPVDAESDGQRTVGARCRYVPNSDDAAEARAAGRRLPVPTSEEWFRRHPPLELPPEYARVAGPDYMNRREIAEAELLAPPALVPPGVLLSLTDGSESDGGGSAERKTMRDAVLALPWERGPFAFREIWSALEARGVRVNESTLTVALRGLKKDGLLEQDGPKQPYRRAEKENGDG